MSTQNIAFGDLPGVRSPKVQNGCKRQDSYKCGCQQRQSAGLSDYRQQASTLADTRITPTMAPSTTTMALSTSIPRAMINAPATVGEAPSHRSSSG